MLKYFLCWIPMLLLAIINGAARDLWYKRYVGELSAHQISTVSLIILMGLYIGLIMKKYPAKSGTQAIYVGLLWLTLTLSFEFGFGLMRGHTLTALLSDYNMMNGHIWILIPFWLTLAPYLFFKMYRR